MQLRNNGEDMWKKLNHILIEKGMTKKERKIMKKELTPQQRANKKWNARNREHKNYLTKRSTSRGFIRNNATKDDLLELQELIKENLKKF